MPTNYITVRRPINATVLVPNQVFHVDSDVLSTVVYDFNSTDGAGPLTLVFRNGNTYRYADVPESHALNLLAAGSHGTYYNRWIKGQYVSTPL